LLCEVPILAQKVVCCSRTVKCSIASCSIQLGTANML